MGAPHLQRKILATVERMTTLPVGGFPDSQRKFSATVGRSNAQLHYQWGDFQIHNINFLQQLDGRTHEHYHSLGLTQAHPYMFLVCSDHKGMFKNTSEVNSLLCCASLLVVVAISRLLCYSKCIYNLIASTSFYLWYSW